MNKEITKRNAFWLVISTLITVVFAVPVSMQKRDTLIEKACGDLPYRVSYRRQIKKYTPEDVMQNKVKIDLLEGVSVDDMAVEVICNDAFDQIKNQNIFWDTVFNILQLWLLMSVVTAYVIKPQKN